MYIMCVSFGYVRPAQALGSYVSSRGKVTVREQMGRMKGQGALASKGAPTSAVYATWAACKCCLTLTWLGPMCYRCPMRESTTIIAYTELVWVSLTNQRAVAQGR